jgi:hypothetical protein
MDVGNPSNKYATGNTEQPWARSTVPSRENSAQLLPWTEGLSWRSYRIRTKGLLRDRPYSVVLRRDTETGGNVRYRLPIVLPKDALIELLRRARERVIPVEALIIEILEGYVEGSRKTPKLVRSARKPSSFGSWPQGT